MIKIESPTYYCNSYSSPPDHRGLPSGAGPPLSLHPHNNHGTPHPPSPPEEPHSKRMRKMSSSEDDVVEKVHSEISSFYGQSPAQLHSQASWSSDIDQSNYSIDLKLFTSFKYYYICITKSKSKRSNRNQ